MRVDIERIIELDEERKKINGLQISDIEFHKEGKRIHFEKRLLDDWRFIGMSNVDFITTGYFEEGSNKVYR